MYVRACALVALGSRAATRQVLASCARTLESKADAGDAHLRLPEGANTAAFKVLELVRELSAKHAAVCKRKADADAMEVSTELKVRALKSKVSAQGLALKLEASRAAKGAAAVAAAAPAAATLPVL